MDLADWELVGRGRMLWSGRKCGSKIDVSSNNKRRTGVLWRLRGQHGEEDNARYFIW